jgi:hypothetical protein
MVQGGSNLGGAQQADMVIRKWPSSKGSSNHKKAEESLVHTFLTNNTSPYSFSFSKAVIVADRRGQFLVQQMPVMLMFYLKLLPFWEIWTLISNRIMWRWYSTSKWQNSKHSPKPICLWPARKEYLKYLDGFTQKSHTWRLSIIRW